MKKFIFRMIKKIKKYLFIKKVRQLSQKIRQSTKYEMWKLTVLSRDKHKCRQCNSTYRLEVHHVISFATILKANKILSIKEANKCKLLWNINNGLTLCHSCHKKTKSYKKRCF